MPLITQHNPDGHNFHPHIGMRKIKSILAIFVGFCLWQILRIFLPELEIHPIFIYIYGLIEIRENSEKTRDYGKMRIKATFTAIILGLPFMLLYDLIKPMMTPNLTVWSQIIILMVGTLLVLCVAELAKCRVYCGLAAAIYIILMLSHFESSVYLYSIMRAVQTIIGVTVAWVINVKLLPYPPRTGSFSDRLSKRITKKDTTEIE